MMDFLLSEGPTRAVRSSRTSSGGREVGGVETKDVNEGPVLRRS